MWITCVPLAWLVVVCFTAGWQKIFSDQPRLGFLADAARLQSLLDSGKVAAANVSATQTQIFNNYLDAVMCGLFMVLVATILIDSMRVWYGVLRGTRKVLVSETPFVMSRLQTEEL